MSSHNDESPLLGSPHMCRACFDSTADYKIRIMRDDGIYLTSVHHTLQMRPSLECIDRIGEKAATIRDEEVAACWVGDEAWLVAVVDGLDDFYGDVFTCEMN
jgi:hypothetical protein